MRLLMVSNKIRAFSTQYQIILDTLSRLGHEVVWAADFSHFSGDRALLPCVTEQISIRSNPLHPANWRAYRQVLGLLDRYGIEGVLCSTPIGGAVARAAAFRKGVRPVLYEAHGFLFFRGAPWISRLLFRGEERLLARVTDALITINREDDRAARALPLRAGGRTYLVHGAGVDTGVCPGIDRAQKRRELGVPADAFLIVSAGELNKNKNTKTAVRAMAAFQGQNVHYIACGAGKEKERLTRLATRLGIASQVHLPGWRRDVKEILAAADAFVIMSFREGLPRSLLEAMDLGLPCAGADTRGIRDLIGEEGGFLFPPGDPSGLAAALGQIKDQPEKRQRMGARNRAEARAYSSAVVRQEMDSIYREVFGVHEAAP